MRVLVLSLATSGYDLVFRRNIESQNQYCRRHRYTYTVVRGEDNTTLGREISWLKLPLLLGGLKSEFDAVLFLDSDVQVSDTAAPLSDILNAYPDRTIFLANGHSRRPNAGVILCRNTPPAKDILTRILRAAGTPLPPKANVGWGENGHVIHALEGEPSFQLIDRVWNNSEELDGRSNFYHFTGPLRPYYIFDEDELLALNANRARDQVVDSGRFMDRYAFYTQIMIGYRTARTGRESMLAPFDPAWITSELLSRDCSGVETPSPRLTVHVCMDVRGTNSANPYVEQLVDHLRERAAVTSGVSNFWTRDYAGCDVLHLQWAEVLTGWERPTDEMLTRISSRLSEISRTTRIFFTVHNLNLKAEFGEMAEALMDVIGHHADAFIHLSQASVTIFSDRYKAFRWIRKPSFVIGHGNYDVYFDNAARKPSFALPDKPYVLIFGAIRTSDEHTLCEAVVAALRKQGVPIVFAGQVAGHLLDQEQKACLAGLSDSLTVRHHWHVKTEDIPAIFRGAKVVFLPRSNRLNSGVQYLAYTFLKPVVAPRSSTMGEHQAMVGGFTFDPGAENAIAAINATLQLPLSETIRQMDRSLKFKTKQMNWQKIASDHIDAYATIIGGKAIQCQE